MHEEHGVPIWFFIGGMLLVYGILITGAGLYSLAFPPPEEERVALYSLHADIWWGLIMSITGLFYCLRYKPFSKASRIQE